MWVRPRFAFASPPQILPRFAYLFFLGKKRDHRKKSSSQQKGTRQHAPNVISFSKRACVSPNATCLLIGTLCAADKNIDIGGVVSVCGAIFGFIYVFLLPSMIRLEATKEEEITRRIVEEPHHRYPLRSRHAVIQEEEGEENEPSERRRLPRTQARHSSKPFWSAHSYQTLFFHGIFVAFGFSILVSNVF